MVSFIVRLRFHQEDRAEVAESLRLLATASRQEPGCVSYVPHQLEGDPDTVLIYEQYVDQKAVAGIYQKMLERGVENLLALV